MFPSLRILLLGGLLLAGIAACRPFGLTDGDTARDSLRIAALLDSLTVFIPADTSAAAPAPAEPAPDFIVRPSADSMTISAALLDSLFQEIARLNASVAGLEQVSRADTVRQTPAVAAAADSTAVVIQDRLGDAARGVGSLGLPIFLSILAILATFLTLKATVWLFETLAERSATRRLFFKKLVPIVRIGYWALATYIIIIYIFAVDNASLLGAWTAIGVAVGFAAQDILKNIFGGIIIIFDQPFQSGDKINVGGTYGEVVSIGLRSTRIVTPDDNLVSVPNAQIVENQVANANAGALDCQVVVDLYLPGWVDVKEAKAIAYEAAANSRYVYLEKPIVVNVRDEFKEMFLTHLKVKAYVLDTRYEFVFASDVTETAKAEFMRKGMLPPLMGVRAFVDPNGTASTPAS